jgi:hypothetical protein
MDYNLLTAIISILIFLSFTIIGISFATEEDNEKEDSEDVVGDILEDQGVDRNPPEVEDNSEVIPPEELANNSEIANETGSISSFTEGPVLVTNSTINVIEKPES